MKISGHCRRILIGVLAAMAAMYVPGQTGTAAGSTVERVPEVHARSLSGAAVDLPGMFKGRVGVLVLGFSRDAQSQATAWGKRLVADYPQPGNVLFLEMPMLAAVPRLLRGMVVRSISKEVSERSRASFVPLTEEEVKWRSLAHVGDPAQAYVLVVDETGGVRWQTEGSLTDASYGRLKQTVEQLRVSVAAGR